MPRPKEVTAEEDSLDSRSHATDEEAVAPHQFQGFKKAEYDTLHLSPGRSVLKVLWERVSAEIAQRSGHTMQAGIKGSLAVRKTWVPPTTCYEDSPVPRQWLPSAEEKPSAEVAWSSDSAAVDPMSIADVERESQAGDKKGDQPEQQLTETDQEISPSLAVKPSAQVIWDRVTTVVDRKSVTSVQVDSTSYTGSIEEQQQVEAVKEGNDLSLDTANPEHQQQLEEDITSSEKPREMEIEDTTSSKTQDSTSDFAPRGEQEDQDSVEENVTTYDAPTKEQLEENVPLEREPNDTTKTDTPTFGTKEITGRFTDYFDERTVFKEEVERCQYSPNVMDAQQTGLPTDEVQEDVKPRHMLHEDAPKSKTVELLSCISDDETKRDGSEEGEEVSFSSFNPAEAADKEQQVEEKTQPRETTPAVTPDSKMEALRRELEAMEGFDDEDDYSLYEEEPLSLRPPRAPEAAGARAYVMPDPVRARVDNDVLLYHVPRSPEAPRRFTDKVFFRFKVLAAYAGYARRFRV